LFNEIPTELNNSLNPRPELLAGVYDDLLVLISHYLSNLGLEGGQGVIRLFIGLNYAPYEII
jgi:hypothetical protein